MPSPNLLKFQVLLNTLKSGLICRFSLIIIITLATMDSAAGQTNWNVSSGVYSTSGNWTNGIPGVGNSGSISNGGTATSTTDISVGAWNLTLANSSALSLTFNSLTVASSANSSITVNTGGVATTGSGYVGTNIDGNSSGKTGALLIDGSGSKWNAGSFDLGKGTATIQAGGQLISGQNINIGYANRNNGYSGGNASATVTGTGSLMKSVADLRIGNAGTGTLFILAGGQLQTGPSPSQNFGNAYIGNGSQFVSDGSSGSVTVNGVGSTWTDFGALTVGYFRSTGSLSIEAGALVDVRSSATVGNFSNGSGAVTVTGAGSKWKVTNDVQIGISGSLSVQDGGKIESNYGTVDGTAVIDGANSSWTTSQSIIVRGSLSLQNGAKAASAAGGYVGNSAGSLMTVTGANSQWTVNSQNNSDFIVNSSSAGTATLSILSEGVVQSNVDQNYIGYSGSGTGKLIVDGAGSKFSTPYSLRIGESAAGVMIVRNGGEVRSGSAFVGHFSGSSGTVTVTGRESTWTVQNTINIGSSAAGGSLTITGGGLVSSLYGNITSNTGSASVTIDGSLSKWRATNGYLAVGTNGSLLLQNGGQIETSAIYIQDGGKLGGSGTITAASVFVDSGGRIESLTMGILTISGDLILASGSTFVAKIAGDLPGSQYDQIQIINGGNLNIEQATLNLDFSGTPTSPFKTLFTLTGGGAIQGQFLGQPEGSAAGNYNNSTYYIHYTPETVYLDDSPSPVPEPASILIICTCIGSLVYRRSLHSRSRTQSERVD